MSAVPIKMKISVGQESKDEVKVPFLTTQKMPSTTPLLQCYQDTCSGPQQDYSTSFLFQSIFQNSDFTVMQSIINLIQKSEREKVIEVKMKGKDVAIPSGKIACINCRQKLAI